MDLTQMALVVNRGYRDEARSALPNAPVVDDEVAHPRRSRSVTAGLLRRLADVLYPEPETGGLRLAAGRERRRSPWDESPCKPSPTASA